MPAAKRAAANQAVTSTPATEYTVPLRGTSLVVHSGELVALSGSVGCGKSTLLAACWGEALVVDGSVHGPSELGLMPQRPFIIGGSVLDNILMGRPLEHDWFARVIRQCALEEDMKQLPHAESTIVGERGVTLSGGQQQRVAVARALYGKPKLLLADDPLSAVDAAVARRLWREAVRTGTSPTFPYLDHRDKNRRRNGKKCMGISDTAIICGGCSAAAARRDA